MDPGLIAELARAHKKRALWIRGRETREVDLGRPAIERLLPHRDPFLLLDGITAIDLSVPGIAARRRIDPADPLFVGHFPCAPIYPGVLQLEVMGQAGICLAHFVAQGTHEVPRDATPRPVRAIKIHTAIFVAEVLPGDDLTVLGTVLESDDFGAVCAGQLLRGDAVASFAIMEVHLVET